MKNDERDANDLVDLLRLGRLAEAWIAPPELRELRELVRYRHKLVRLRSGLKAQVHAVMGKHGVLPARVDMFGPGGTAQLDALELPAGLRVPARVAAATDRHLRPTEITDARPSASRRRLRRPRRLPGDRRPSTVSARCWPRCSWPRSATSPGSTPPHRLCSWAGMTPSHRESDTKIRRGSITKQGSRLVRWAAVEAVVQEPRRTTRSRNDYRRIAERRGTQHRPRRRRPQTSHPRLLRPTRRRDPLPRDGRGRVTLGRSQQTGSESA